MPKTVKCKILEIIERTSNVKSFRLRPEEAVDYQAGQFMSVSLDVNGSVQSKYFTISGSPAIKDYIEFTKKITDSAFSKALNELRPGDELTITMPMGRFTLDRSNGKIAFLCGGIGITPIRGICQYVKGKSLDKDIVLIYGNHRQSDIAFKEELDQMAGEFERFRVVHVLDNPQGEWKGYTGFINKVTDKAYFHKKLLRKKFLIIRSVFFSFAARLKW